MRRRRMVIAGWIVAAVVAIALVVLLIAHLPGVQRAAWNRVTASIEASTGYSINADHVSARLLSGRFQADHLKISVEGRPLATVERLVATWTWRGLLGEPRRIESLLIVAPEIALQNLPSPKEDEPPVDPGELLGMAELGTLEIRGGSLTGAAADIGWSVSDVRVNAGLDDSRASLELAAGGGILMREDRAFELGAVDASLEADASGFRLDHLRLDGTALRLDVGEAAGRWDGTTELRVPLRTEVDLVPIVSWWDPSLLNQVELSGTLVLDGVAGLDAAGAPFAEIVHRGEPISVSGIGVDSLTLSHSSEITMLSAGGAEWGVANVAIDPESNVAAELVLEDAAVRPLVALSPQPLPIDLPDETRIAGRLQANLTLPVQPEAIVGSADLVLTWPDGRLSVVAIGDYEAVTVQGLTATVPGGKLEASGRIEPQGSLDLKLAAVLQDPKRALASIARIVPDASAVSVGGGPLDVRAAVKGTVQRPYIDAALQWKEPMVAGEPFMRLDADAAGFTDGLDWNVAAEVVEGTTARASGRTAITTFKTLAEWSVFSEDVELLAARAPVDTVPAVCGRLAAAGHLSWNDGVWRIGGEARGVGLGTGPWLLDELDLEFVANPDRAEVARLDAWMSGAQLSGWASVPLVSRDGDVAAQLKLEGLDPARLPLDLPPELSGEAAGRIDVAGTMAEPTAELQLDFTGEGVNAPLQSATLRAALADGVLRLASSSLESAAGPVTISATAPLGDLPLPEWMWPDAESGPIHASAHAQRLRAAPLLRSIGAAEMQGTDIVCDLDAEVLWDLNDADQRTAEILVRGAEIQSELERLEAEGPIRLVLRDGRVVLDPVRVSGAKSQVDLAGSYDLESSDLTTSVHAKFDPAIGRMLPLPLTIRGPLDLDAELAGPLSAIDGTIELNHRNGVMVMKDPAMEVRDLVLSMGIEDGVVSIRNGSAGINRGMARFSGGWDTQRARGIVIELEDVAFLLPYGILSRWNGTLGIDPSTEHLARMYGNLELEGGLWDRPFDYAGVLFGTGDPGLAADDPLNDIILDLEVRGRNGIEVDNNLGTFQVNWDRIRVGGTLATPLLDGQVKIVEGGLLTIAGASIPVRRGMVEFTGQPGVEPRLEIVSAADIFNAGSGQIDPTLIAARGLATGLGKALGFENETLQPAEIAIETGTDTTTRFAVGQRLSRNLSLIISTDLTDVQDVQTLIQLQPGWPKGLALQAFQETATEEFGGAVIERFRWGGTATEDDQAKIYRIRLEGEWPVSKRRLTKAAGIAKGKPYDRFLLFAAGIRMEQELASEGYYDARVTAEAEGSEKLPKLVFSCELGPWQEVVFDGDTPPKEIRRRVRALYQAPPQEDAALAAMRQLLTRHFAGKGYPDASISVAKVDGRVVAEVDRGAKQTLSGPQIEGVPQRSAVWLRAALGSPAELAAALDNPERAERIIRKTLRNTGYSHVESIRLSTEPVDDDEKIVKIEILPGPPDTIASVGLDGTDPLDLLDEELGVETGMAVDRYALDRAVSTLRRQYQEAGYADVEVATRLEETAPLEWQVWFEISPGPKVTVDEIAIKGLRHIDEDVIRKGLSFGEGDLLRLSELDASATKIANFAPVERIDVRPVPSGVGTATVEIGVTEKPRWMVGGGVLWRSERGMQALFDLRDDNLFERGFSLNLRGSWQTDEQRGLIVMSLPPLPGGRISTSLTADYYAGDSKVDPKVLNEETTGGSLEVSYLLGPSSKISAYTRGADTFLFEKIPDDFFPFEQSLRTVSIGGHYTRDTFDDPFDPRSGSYLAADVEWSSSAFGSDLDSVRSLLTGAVVFEPRGGWSWSHRVRFGIAEALKGTTLDPTQRYFAGGQASMRGFVVDSVGPLVPSSDGGLVGAGGGALFILNEELRVPVWKNLRLAVFTDIGQVWESWRSADFDLSLGAGLGFRYSTPIGPLWGDVAWPILNKGISEGAKYYFGIGRSF